MQESSCRGIKSHVISLNVRARYVRKALKSRCFSLLLLISIEQRSIDHVVEIINTSPTTDCS